MNREITKRHNAVVRPGDTVFDLGDFALYHNQAMVADRIKKLNGTHVLIRGNHDMHKGRAWWIRAGFSECYDGLGVGIGPYFCLLSHKPIKPEEIKSEIDCVICGHLHNTRPAPPRHVCVSIELTDYRPISESELIERIKLVIAR